MGTLKTLAAAAAVLAAGTSLAAAQSVRYRPLTVAPHRTVGPDYDGATGYNPYAGPGAIVTGPVHLAGTIATAPFRAANTVFPPHGNTPLVIVGGPVYVAGKLVELPFRMVEAPFGGPAPFQD